MARYAEVDNTQDILDSRDCIARLEELESERETLVSNRDEAKEAVIEFHQQDTKENEEDNQEEIEKLGEELENAEKALTEWDEGEEGNEYRALKSFCEDAEGYAEDWRYGAALIRDSYFEEYARQFADDIGAIDRNASWPLTCIDWKQAAEELQQDYTAIEFDGVTYWVR